MVKGNELCLAFVRYVTGFENSRHFLLVPSPPMKKIFFRTFNLNYLKMSKDKNDVPNNVNIINLNAATRL